ncbi:MAG: hypothetical protein A3G18_00600 [Rhodospirillales bacterium RIFCSPLOWO2_12_FULL_58_28]|nr:MAG: hypothetical protein A3H92_05535 [Rhodospirillales bacterium RIFCSPLOWO2_02_FULL_58_16]OHC77033.1 MAG: hypothetical protein A3G18_00600 [Rhodospirillales bacterium RIFCSPLOWO2_12_FULL_58_28]
MKSGALTALTAVTVIAVIAAALSTGARDSRQAVEGTGQKAFPRLLNTINDVNTIAIKHPNGAMTIERYPDRWGVVEKGGFPVQGVAVRKFLLDLARLEQAEAKTGNKERHAQLNLLDPANENANSTGITIKDKGGKVMAALIVGNNAGALKGLSGTYIRKPDDDQTWLAGSELNVSVRARDWVEKAIIDIPPKNIAKVVIRHPDASILTVSKSSPEDAHYAVENLPPDAKLKSEYAADAMAAALDKLELDDVNKADAMTFAEEFTVKAELTTFDGLTVAIDLLELGGKHWIKPAVKSADGKPESAKRADDLNARIGPWAYQVAAFKVSDLKKRMSDLLKTKKSGD